MVSVSFLFSFVMKISVLYYDYYYEKMAELNVCVLQLLEETNKHQATTSAVVPFFLAYLSP